MIIDRDENWESTLYCCDRCNEYITDEENIPSVEHFRWRDIFSSYNLRGHTPKFLREVDLCHTCYKHFDRYIMTIIDVMVTKSYCNILERNIRERIKNDRTD